MFSSMWNFVKRHKKKILFTGALVGGAIFIGKYAKHKIMELQDKEAAEYHTFARRQHHFENNQRTCNMTALSMIPNLREALLQFLNSEPLTAELKTKPANRVDIWNKLKVMSFTRTVVAIYASCMLIVALRVRLNIIGGYMYLETLGTKDSEHKINTITSPDVQQRYLEYINYILDEGLCNLIELVQASVENVVNSLSLKDKISLEDLMIVINRIRKNVESMETNKRPAHCLVRFIYPAIENKNESFDTGEQIHLKLGMETQDIFESGDFSCVMNNCLDTAFTRLLDKMAEYYKSSNKENSQLLANIHDVELPLAKLIPIMNGMTNIMCADAPNSFIQELLLKDKLKDFSANIYEAFSQPDEANKM